MQAATDGCQSLLCFNDRFVPVFFMLENKRKSYFVERFFKEISKKGLENGPFFCWYMRGVFWTVVKIAICVEQFFKVFLNKGFKNCFYLSLLMRGFLLFASKCRIMPNDFMRKFLKRGLQTAVFCPYKWRVFLFENFFKCKGFFDIWLISLF